MQVGNEERVQPVLRDRRDRFDDHGFKRHVLAKRATRAGRHLADALDHVKPVDDLAEHGVAPAQRRRVEFLVVGEVDVELGIARVRRVRARKSDRATLVGQPIAVQHAWLLS